MNRMLVILGGLASCGAAYISAGIAPATVRDLPSTGNRGRVEFELVRSMPTDVDLNVAGVPDPSAVDPAAVDLAPEAGAGTDPTPEAAPDPVAQPDLEPKPIEILVVDDVRLCQADNGKREDLGRFVHLQLDIEGIPFWVTSKTRNEVDSQRKLKKKLDVMYGSPLVIVPDQETLWQEVSKTLDTAYGAAVKQCFLGVCTKAKPTELLTLTLSIAPPDAGLPEGDHFVIAMKDGKPTTVNGVEIGTDPSDLAQAWYAWKGDHPDADPSDVGTSPVIMNIHRFTPLEQVAPVIGVLRGLGVAAERYQSKIFQRKR